MSPALIVVLCGPTACGKTSVANSVRDMLTARGTSAVCVEGDAFHPPANVDKMRAGVPLCDDDRWEWLDAVGDAACMRLDEGAGVVLVACSALRFAYRERLRRVCAGSNVCFVRLHAAASVLTQRMQQRHGHFMNIALVDSQLALWEDFTAQEQCKGRTFSIDVGMETLESVVARVAAYIAQHKQ